MSFITEKSHIYRPFSGSFFSHLVRTLRKPRSRFHHVGQGSLCSSSLRRMKFGPCPSSAQRKICRAMGAVSSSTSRWFLSSGSFRYPKGATQPVNWPCWAFRRYEECTFLEISLLYI